MHSVAKISLLALSLDSLPRQSVTGVRKRGIAELIFENINNLQSLSKEDLHHLWQQTFKLAPSPRLRREIMLPVLAYRLQEQSNPNLTSEARTLLDKAITTLKAPGTKSSTQVRRGTRIVREWKGQVHEVLVTEDGFEYKGERFKSLSPIACRITGTHWSGPAFFGTKGKKR
jgi:hypothetical protein